MIIIENVVLPSAQQWRAIIRGMRNPKNSWDLSDSPLMGDVEEQFFLGENDLDLMNRLAKAGSVHGKYRRMIPVFVDITAPLYWWKEFDTYKVGTVANSCSTMHKIQAKHFEPIDFSWEHIDKGLYGGVCNDIIAGLNVAREDYLKAVKSKAGEAVIKDCWWQMIQLLPSAYNQKRTVLLNYEVLTNIYEYRQNHKLDEWRDFCKWIEQLPYFNEIVTHR